MNKREKISVLYEPFDCGLFEARNRFVRSGTWLAGAEEKTGSLTSAEIRRYAELGCGCVGTVITGISYINRDGKSFPRQCGLDSDDRISEIECLSETLHKRGSRLVVQLGHGGSYKTLEVARGSRTVSPSGVRFPGTNLMSQKITTFEITKLRSDFADAALRAKKGGADGVQIHGGHGFLLNEFLSPILNKRDDRYGGTLQNRERIFLEVYEKVRETVGKSFPIFFKLSIEEGISGGYPAEEGMDLAKNLLKAGVDGIEVSSGTPYADIKHLPSMIGVSAGESEAPFKRFSEELKKCVVRRDQVIILCGGLRSLSTMSQLVTDGVCDMVSMSRPLNCEPDLINRWAEEDDRPSACISCNACFKTAAHGMINCPVMRNRNEGNWDAL